MRLTFDDMAQHLGLSTRAQGIVLNKVVTDSRDVTPGSLFVCIPGNRVDGHDFVQAAIAGGASALLASRFLPGVGIPTLCVQDTVKALGEIALLWRRQTKAKIVGVTGTAGKTTVKDVLAKTLAVHGKTAKSPVNNNNQIGMPRAILATDGDEQFWVMEVGISHAGDMDELARTLQPDIGLILNVGTGHTQGLGEMGVAWHKASLLRHLSPSGMGLVCADYPDLVREARNTGVVLRFFSAEDRNIPYHASYVGPSTKVQGYGIYSVCLHGCCHDVTAPFMGHYGAENVAAVASCAHILGLTAEEIISGLAQASLPVQRFREICVGSWLCIDDTYNANPLSMRRMLDAAAERASGRPLVVVLGEMLELGTRTASEHEALGRYLAHIKPISVFWKGGQADAVRSGLVAGGYAGEWMLVEDVAHFVRAWEACFSVESTGGVVLFKGSRSNHMETLLLAVFHREQA